MTGVRRLWTVRIGAAAALWAVVVLVARAFGNRPDVPLLALLTAAGGCITWLFLDASTQSETPTWELPDDAPVRQPGEDPRLALYARVVAGHLDAREVGDSLHRHLLRLADRRLVARHGITREADPDRAAELLGPEFDELARDRPPYPRLDPRRIDVLLARIEAL